MSAENIKKLYEMMSANRCGFDKKLLEVQDLAKCAQDAFDELAESNSFLGAGVIPPILHCITTHVMSAARKPDSSYEECYNEVAGYLAPMIVMHYDAYTKKCLDGIDTVLNDDSSEGE